MTSNIRAHRPDHQRSRRVSLVQDKASQAGAPVASPLCAVNFVFEIDFMVKLLRACVWMPWRKEAMKDVDSCDKPREDAISL
jgi:hypothetical protein